MAKPKKPTEPIFTISIEKGLADRHRLPIGQVISVLTEVRQMITEAGRAIQRERGIEAPPADFGLEVLADESGVAFIKGSFRARIAITNHLELGVAAAGRVLSTVKVLNAPKKPPALSPVLGSFDSTASIVNRLDRIAFIQEKSHAQAKFMVAVPAGLKPKEEKIVTSATFGANAVRRLETLQEPVFSESNVTLYGRLVELKDTTQVERESSKFWGELRRDNGQKWRVQFTNDAERIATQLFRRQVRITGDAFYFVTRNPKLVASQLVADEQRDLPGAFDEMFGAFKQAYDADLATLLNRRYE